MHMISEKALQPIISRIWFYAFCLSLYLPRLDLYHRMNYYPLWLIDIFPQCAGTCRSTPTFAIRNSIRERTPIPYCPCAIIKQALLRVANNSKSKVPSFQALRFAASSSNKSLSANACNGVIRALGELERSSPHQLTNGSLCRTPLRTQRTRGYLTQRRFD